MTAPAPTSDAARLPAEPRQVGVLWQAGLPVILGFVAVCLIWGSTWLAIKIGIESIPPYLSVALRFVLASVILAVVMMVRGIRLPAEREFWSLATLMAVGSFSVPFALIYWAQQYIPTSLASILFATFPFCVAIFSHYRLPSEQMTPVKWLGVTTGFVGVCIIFAREVQFETGVSAWGMGAVVLAALMQANNLVTVKKRGGPFHPMSLTLAGMMLGAVLTFAISAVLEDWSEAVFDAPAIASLVYLAAFGSVVTFVTYFWLLKRVEAVLLSLIAFVTPVLAIVLGTVVLQERLAAEVFLGSLFVLAGILLANARGMYRSWKQRRAARPA
jgi:drug/metabolite transporter (DMT)-like permease